MATTSASLTGLLAPDLRKVYIEVGKDWPLEYPLVMNTPEMEWNPITDRNVSGLGVMPTKPEGTRFTLDDILMGSTKTYLSEAYGMAVEITFEAWRDELYGVLQEMVRCLGRSSRHRLEYDAFQTLNFAFSTARVGFAAGESLCSIAHVGMDGITRANRPNPDEAFGVTSLQDAMIRFELMTDERNMPRLMAPQMLLLAPQNKWAAREILGSAGKPYQTSNEINSLVAEDLTWMIGHYLTSTSAWWLLCGKGIHDLNFFVRTEPIFDMYDDPSTKNGVCNVYQSHVGGFGAWRGVDGSTG